MEPNQTQSIKVVNNGLGFYKDHKLCVLYRLCLVIKGLARVVDYSKVCSKQQSSYSNKDISVYSELW